jgi:hypothetical protein
MLGYSGYFLVGQSYSPARPDNAGMLGRFQLDLYLGKLFGLAFGYRSSS